MVPFQCAMESPELGEYFTYLERYHTRLTKFSRATQSQKVDEKREESRKFRTLILDVYQSFVKMSTGLLQFTIYFD